MSPSDDQLYRQNEDQYAKIHENARRIAAAEAELQTIRTALIGIDGTNGIRGEVRELKRVAKEDNERIMKRLSEMDAKRDDARRWHWETLIAAGGVVAAFVAIIVNAGGL